MTSSGLPFTLPRALARLGYCSRTEARLLVASGRVALNGARVDDPDAAVDPGCDRIEVDGAPVRPAAVRTAKLHKPAGVLTAARDPGGRKTVLDLLPALAPRVVPVGRLDLDSSGLLLLTNDGALGHRVLAGPTALAKVYQVEVAGAPADSAFAPLRAGIDLGDVRCRPADVAIVRRTARSTWLEIALTEGRRRQIRRSLQRVGLRVRTLHRVRIGPILLGDLAPGAVAELTLAEAAALYAAVGLEAPRLV